MADTDDEGVVQVGGETPAGEGPSNIAALLDDEAELLRRAYGESVEDSPESRTEPEASDDDDEDDEPEASDEEDEEEESADDEDDDEDEDEEEDEPEAGFDPKKATAADWAFELMEKPQRYSEVPKRLREAVDTRTGRLRELVTNAMQYAVNRYREGLEATSTLRELYEVGDLEAFHAEAEKDPQAYTAFLDQQRAEAAARAARAAGGDGEAIAAAAQVQIAKLDAHPEAKARVMAEAVTRGWNQPGSATAAMLSELTELVTRELAGAAGHGPSKKAEKARRTQEAAERRRKLPKAAVSPGGAGKAAFNADEYLAMSDAERARIAYGG